ncbi:MAG: hypothetical protein ABIY70_16020 [Capsulimonas sp.]|uniref:hypothetical protein n=1 Tax=Capsulimonas sp. TaxID=2494211 RepID=UPI0032670737
MQVHFLGSYQTPKVDCAASECEDRYAICGAGSTFAISDGASNSIFAGEWAQSLVDQFIASPTTSINASWLRPATAALYSHVDFESLPWHGVAKFTRGVFATLSGLFFDCQSQRFSTVSIGDSVIVWRHLQSGRAGMLPSMRSQDFERFPHLICHLPERNIGLFRRVRRRKSIKLPSGDTSFYLMTDALCHWYVSECERGREPWQALCEITSQDDFVDFIVHLRRENILKNDDTTLISLRVSVEKET